MRYKPEQKQQTAANILAAAERGFRLGGYGGIGVDGLAQEAGVTSGAFYKHFRSKAAVFEAAINAGMQRYLDNIETADEKWLEALADYYLGREHRRNIAEGCVVTGLSSEVARSSEQVRIDYQAGIEKVADKIAGGLTGADEEERRQRAWIILAMLAGGVLLSRAVHDEIVADDIASAVQQGVLDFK